MAGWLTDGVPNFPILSGAAQVSIDTERSNGAQPQTASLSLQQLATLMSLYNNHADKTTVAGSRYYTSFTLGYDTDINGIGVLVGSTGGTDKWIAELHDANGVLLATSDTGGVTAGTAASFQNLPFATPYLAPAGSYFLAIQSNGTTAKLATYNAPATGLGSGVLTGSATGTFGTGAAITPPTTYTANLGPVVQPY